jgi:phospholipase C
MPREKLLNLPTTPREYHKEYYKRNKELIRAKRLLTEKNIVTEDVKQWKINKMNDPWAFYPFYDPNSKKRYGEEPDISNAIVASCSKGSTPPNTESGTVSG